MAVKAAVVTTVAVRHKGVVMALFRGKRGVDMKMVVYFVIDVDHSTAVAEIHGPRINLFRWFLRSQVKGFVSCRGDGKLVVYLITSLNINGSVVPDRLPEPDDFRCAGGNKVGVRHTGRHGPLFAHRHTDFRCHPTAKTAQSRIKSGKRCSERQADIWLYRSILYVACRS